MRKVILLFPLALAACGGSSSGSGPAMISPQAAGANPCAFADELQPGPTAFQGTVFVDQPSPPYNQ